MFTKLLNYSNVSFFLTVCLSVYLSIYLSMYLNSPDNGDVSAGAQQGRLTMS